jgi:hypothetical protein
MRPITRPAPVSSTLQSLLSILVLSLAFTSGSLLAQEAETVNDVQEPDAAATAAETDDATPADGAVESEASVGRTGREYEVRDQLYSLVRTYQPGLGSTLAFHPDLLSDREFLSSYPALADFLDLHPEVRREPYFYFGQFQTHHYDPADALLEVIAILGTVALVALALAWLIRTWIEQRRWNRLSKNQIDVHNRILDRFGSSEELLEYVRTSAGTRFLEAAPIAVHTERGSSPQARIVRTVQIGVIVVAAALGALLISGRFDDEGSRVLFSLGVIALSVGVGFIGSAVVSNVLSQRLGLWDDRRSSDPALAPGRDEIVG